MARKRILAILASCDFEGVWQQCSRLSADLPTKEFDVRIAMLSAARTDVRLVEKTGLPVYTVGSGRAVGPLILWPLIRLIQQQQPDLVHCWDSTTNLYGSLAARIAGVQSIFCNAWQPTDSSLDWKKLAQLLIKEQITKMIVSSRMLHETDHALQGLADGIVEIISPAIAQYAEPSIDRNRLLEKFGIPDSSYLIATSDSMEAATRLREIIWATELLKVAGHNVRVFICGKGNKSKLVERFRNQVQLQDSIYFLEDHDLIGELMDHLDIYWQFGGPRGKSIIPTVEAMRRGIPVIADRSAIHGELMQHEKTGILVPCGDPASLASWTQHLLEHSDLCQRIGAMGRDHVKNQFLPEATLAAITQLYQQSLGNS